MEIKKVAVFVSGGGTNLQAIIDAKNAGKLPFCELSLVLSSNDSAYALTRAKDNGIASVVVSPKAYASKADYAKALIETLEGYGIDIIVLAGFMSILDESFIQRYENRILNVHPSLIPSFCGEGFYGLRVHEAALMRGVKLTGATVHFVNEVADGGPIIIQRAVQVLDGDTPQVLQKRVMEQAEWDILPRALALLSEEKITVENDKVFIKQ